MLKTNRYCCYSYTQNVLFCDYGPNLLYRQDRIRLAISKLLDEGYGGPYIYKKIQADYGISQKEARLACRDAKAELISRLKKLQPGIME